MDFKLISSCAVPILLLSAWMLHGFVEACGLDAWTQWDWFTTRARLASQWLQPN
jgi:hypothetical protein